MSAVTDNYTHEFLGSYGWPNIPGRRALQDAVRIATGTDEFDGPTVFCVYDGVIDWRHTGDESVDYAPMQAIFERCYGLKGLYFGEGASGYLIRHCVQDRHCEITEADFRKARDASRMDLKRLSNQLLGC
jgi:hypothetical protein